MGFGAGLGDGENEKEMNALVKYWFNRHWRARDQAYKELQEALLKQFLRVPAAVSEKLCPRETLPGHRRLARGKRPFSPP